MIVQETVFVRRTEMAEREEEADAADRGKRRVCFAIQVFCGVVCVILQICDVASHGFTVKEDLGATRVALPGLWAGALFILVGAVHLRWNPRTKGANLASVVAQGICLVVLIPALYLVLGAMIHRDWRIGWPEFVSYFYGVMLAFIFIEIIFLIVSIRSSGQKLLRSFGYLDETNKDGNLLHHPAQAGL